MNMHSRPWIVFRTDASTWIGTGHVMRCLTLADALRERGAQCTFICRPHTGHLMALVTQRGHHTLSLTAADNVEQPCPTQPPHASWLGTDWKKDAQECVRVLGNEFADWLIVDHYALDQRWEKTMRTACKRLMVIDDLADRPHDCDLLLDQNPARTAEDYIGLLTPHSLTFIGPQFALLRPEFARLRDYSLSRRVRPQLKRLLVSMGGVDQDNVTGGVLGALQGCKLPHDLIITVVMGPYAPWLDEVKKQAARMPTPVQVLTSVNNMAQLMADSDLAIGAAGGTAWERCCLGLPSIIFVLADNQQAGAHFLENAGASLTLQSAEDIRDLMQNSFFSNAPYHLEKISLQARQLTQGTGVGYLTDELMRPYD
jgi:UDP-2,4-diacetamido-2,4,6-trideoxy-beta-L-altropyranose hydrolase